MLTILISSVFPNIIYRMTVHILGPDEIVDDPALRDYVLGLFNVLDKRNPCVKTCYSWLPDPAHYLRIWDGFRLYRVFRKIMRGRKHSGGEVHDDSLQYIMGTGASVTDAMGVSIILQVIISRRCTILPQSAPPPPCSSRSVPCSHANAVVPSSCSTASSRARKVPVQWLPGCLCS